MSKPKKSVRWLSKEEAILVGLPPKENDGNRTQNRYHLFPEQWYFINKNRTTPKSRKFVETQKKFDKDGKIVSTLEKLQSEPIDVPEDFEVIKISTSKTTGQQWIQYAPKKGGEIKEDSIKVLHSNFIEDVKKYSFNYPKFSRSKIKDGHCLVFDAADIHLGKICSSFETGETYNSQIAIQRVRTGLNGIIQKSKGWEIDKVIFIAGNDILHVDNAKSTTTSGTGQDTDQMWYDNFLMAKSLLVEIIETLLTIADVEVVFNPSNHDFTHGFMLLDSVSSWFHKCKQVSFDNDMRHRKYTKYGKNIIGSTHMDGAKVDKLHGLMAEEASEFWHECKHRYIYGHHIHHKTAKDIFSVCIETLRSPSGTDGWHHRNGFQFAPKAVEGFIHHKEHGQVAKLIHIF
jgi:hypothetical protein